MATKQAKQAKPVKSANHKIKLSVFNLVTDTVIGSMTVEAGDFVSVVKKSSSGFKNLGIPHFELSAEAHTMVYERLCKLAHRNKLCSRHVAAYADLDQRDASRILDARIERLRENSSKEVDALAAKVMRLRNELAVAEAEHRDSLAVCLSLTPMSMQAHRDAILKANPRVAVIGAEPRSQLVVVGTSMKTKDKPTAEDKIANRNRIEIAKRFALTNANTTSIK